MALHTACILHRDKRHGIAISTMSRHTLSDGKSPDPRLDRDQDPTVYDEWEREVAPPPYLVGSWYKKRITWPEFEEEYLAFLRDDLHARIVIHKIIERAKKEDVTLMCIEETPEFCHRRLLAEECRRQDPDLQVFIN